MKEQTTIRLTLRLTDELDELLRNESIRLGKPINQTMIGILNDWFKNLKSQ